MAASATKSREVSDTPDVQYLEVLPDGDVANNDDGAVHTHVAPALPSAAAAIKPNTQLHQRKMIAMRDMPNTLTRTTAHSLSIACTLLSYTSCSHKKAASLCSFKPKLNREKMRANPHADSKHPLYKYILYAI